MKYNILLVEDNSSFRQTLADTLCAHFVTMNIAEAGSGEDALLKVEQLHPDMIFMDINLPGENGLEATRMIKMRHKNTLIAMLTSYDIPEYRQQAFRNGAVVGVGSSESSDAAAAQGKEVLAYSAPTGARSFSAQVNLGKRSNAVRKFSR